MNAKTDSLGLSFAPDKHPDAARPIMSTGDSSLKCPVISLAVGQIQVRGASVPFGLRSGHR